MTTRAQGIEQLRTQTPKVCAVIVTFNRIDLLRRCVAAVESQSLKPETILVVDNGSRDGTSQYLARVESAGTSLTTLGLPDNLGPAGGFADGMTWCMQQDSYDFLWLMDDDCNPESSCLESQVAAAGEERHVVVYPRSVDETTDTATFRQSWTGVLIPSDVVRVAGVPNRDLFFWSEDREYLFWRLRVVHGVRRIRAPEATMRYVGSHSAQVDPWRYYYMARNRIYYRLWVQRSTPRAGRYWDVFKSSLRLLLGATFSGHDRLGRLRYLILGLIHGFQGRLGKVVDPLNLE